MKLAKTMHTPCNTGGRDLHIGSTEIEGGWLRIGTKKPRRSEAFGAYDSELGDVCLAEPASKERQEDGGH